MTQPKSNSQKVVIIGGGFSGLAIAALLSKEGWDVTLLEKNRTLGGRARVFKKKGFAFDMGPSWYLMPEVFERFLATFGKKPSDFYELIRLDPRYQVVFDDGERVILTDDLEQNMAWFETKEKGAAKKLSQFLKKMEKIYDVATKKLLYEDVWDIKVWTNPHNIRAAISVLTKFRFWQSWDQEVARYFKSEKLRQILEFSAVFLGGTPFNTPALYAILTWADFGKGVWYPKGGMIKVVDALHELAVKHGGKVITNAEVTAIEVNKGKVVGVKTAREYFAADIVIGATDMPHIEMDLLPSQYRTWDEPYWKKKSLGISAMLIYLGINKKIPKLTHHTIYTLTKWQQGFDEILKNKVLPENPSLYISVRSATDRSIVPKNSEEIVVLVPLGSRRYDQNELNAYSKFIVHKLEKLLQVPLRKDIVVQQNFTPNDFQDDYNAYQGTALGLAHTFTQSLWFRPKQQSRKVKGLYYVGQYTNPGVGVPMALISAQLVAKHLSKNKEKEQDSKNIFKNGSTTYYYSSLFFHGQIKKDVFSLYAYVRVIDDLVDCSQPKIKDLEEKWQDTRRAWRGEKVNNTLIENFVELAKRKEFKWEWIEEFWKAMRKDLEKKQYNSFSELEEYMYGSAEVIGLMMAQILDLPDQAMHAAALQGKAMQFVNFIRDVQEDEALGRNYLGYTSGQKKDPQAWFSFVRTQLKMFWQLQERAEAGYRYIPKKYLIPIKTAAEMYTWTAQQIYQNPAVVWEKKIKPHKAKVLMHVLKNSIL